jgi:hypothetical protein
LFPPLVPLLVPPFIAVLAALKIAILTVDAALLAHIITSLFTTRTDANLRHSRRSK